MAETVLAAVPQPAMNHKFRVVIVADGASAAAGTDGTGGITIGCSSVDGLESTRDETTYREGDQPTTPTKHLTMTNYPDVVIERGVTTQSEALTTWYEESVAESSNAYRTVIVYVYGRGQTIVRSYKLGKAQAKGLKLGKLDANSPAVLIDTLTICHESLALSSNPTL